MLSSRIKSSFVGFLALFWVTNLVTFEALCAPSKPLLTDGKIESFLKEHKTIRIGVGAGPGFGHQTAAATIAWGLRDLGFKGRIEIVNLDFRENDKLSVIFPPYKPGGGTIQNVKGDFWIYYDWSMQAESAEPVSLAIMGADDKSISREDLKAETFLKLQPFNWAPEFASHEIQFTGQKTKPLTRELKKVPYRLPHAIFPQTEPEITEMLKGFRQQSAGQAQGLWKLQNHLNKIDYLPFYSFVNRSGLPQLVMTSEALQRAMEKSPKKFDKPVVIALLRDLKNAEQRKIFAEELNRSGVLFFNVSEAEKIETWMTKPTSKIAVVELGELPQPLFDAWLSAQPFAAVVHGVNSMNRMALEGIPFVSSSERDAYPFSLESKPGLRISAKAQKVLTAFSDYDATADGYSLPNAQQLAKGFYNWWERVGFDKTSHLKPLTEFFIQARTDSSDLRKETLKLHEEFSQPEQDKLRQGLSILIESLKDCRKILKAKSAVRF